MPPPTSGIFHPALRVYQVWGTHQGAGKTVLSTVLSWAAARSRRAKGARDHVGFLKPLTVGDLEKSDNQVVLFAFFRLLQGKSLPTWFKSRTLFHQEKLLEGTAPKMSDLKDSDLLERIRQYAAANADLDPPGGWLFLETLDHPDRLLPSGNSQADVYRELQLPAILVGSGSRDGVDKTIEVYEGLRRREYDVQAVVVFKDGTDDHQRAVEHFEKHGVPCLSFRQIPARHPERFRNRNIMHDYWSAMARSNAVKDLLRNLYTRHNKRVMELEAAGALATEASGEGPPEAIHGDEATPPKPSVWDRGLEFSFAVPGKHKHKV